MKNTKSVKFNINEILQESGMFESGFSRYQHKQSCYENGISSPADIAKTAKIGSYATLKEYKSIWIEMGHHCRQTFQGEYKDLKNIDSKAVESFLEKKIDDGVTVKTFEKICSAVNKFGYMIEKDFSPNVTAVKNIANNELSDNNLHRAFENPQKIIDSLSGNYKLVAEMQYNYGLRVGDCKYINTKYQLNGDTLIINNSKGGQSLSVKLSPNHAEQLKNIGILNVNYRSYLTALEKACVKNNDNYTGSHAFRHNYARESMDGLTRKGYTREQALIIVSESMGHHRSDITNRYL